MDGLLRRFPNKRIDKLELMDDLLSDILSLERSISCEQANLKNSKDPKFVYYGLNYWNSEKIEHKIYIKKMAMIRLQFRFNNLIDSLKYQDHYFEELEILNNYKISQAIKPKD